MDQWISTDRRHRERSPSVRAPFLEKLKVSAGGAGDSPTQPQVQAQHRSSLAVFYQLKVLLSQRLCLQKQSRVHLLLTLTSGVFDPEADKVTAPFGKKTARPTQGNRILAGSGTAGSWCVW